MNLLDPSKSRGLPPFLVSNAGINSGLMTFENLAAGIVSEIKSQTFPSGVDSLPTCASKEDHVSMGGYSARKALDVVRNVDRVLAVELLCAVQACHHRLARHPNFTLSPRLQKVFSLCAQHSPILDADRNVLTEYHTLLNIIETGQLIDSDIFHSKRYVSNSVSSEHISTTLEKITHLKIDPQIQTVESVKYTKVRPGETKFGQLKQHFLPEYQDLSSISKFYKEIESSSPLMIVDNSHDSFGSRANMGRGYINSDLPTAWEEFLGRISNVAINPLNSSFFSNCFLIGSLDLNDIASILPVELNARLELQPLFSQATELTHQRLFRVLHSLYLDHQNKTPTVALLNGDHNNMRTLVSSFYAATGEKPTVVYIDVHADARPLDSGPHSGNWLTQLYMDQAVESTFLVGLNPLSNSSLTIENLNSFGVNYQDTTFLSLISRSFSQVARDIVSKIDSNRSVIVSICGDSVLNMPASAGNSMIGYSSFDIYSFLSILAQNCQIRGFNVAEIKPSLRPDQAGAAGEFLTQCLYLLDSKAVS